ncbi:MAG: selenium metabolism hydrolase [Bdellovibrionales bacterium GWB1_55_8]|nr:MAG: selenium metabolism hydrolase [Bdellovibrionales bacterium GWB1_55_8]
MEFRKQAEKYRNDCAHFLRDLIAIPSESAEEGNVALRILEEMRKLGFDKAWSDEYGNVIGQIGTGPTRIVYDGHIDTVGVGNLQNWPHDPFKGKVENGVIWGRGAADNKAATATQVYGAKLFKELAGKDLDQFSVFVVGSVQEEDCDGLGLRYALEKSIGNVDFVCMGECTDLQIYRGHRGRMEINVVARGRSCHGSAPERGDNAIYKMNRLIADIEKLNDSLQSDPFLGKGTCAVTHISCETPSVCAVPDGCRIHIDRRLTHGEDKALAVRQIEELPSFDRESMKVEILTYDRPSYKGKVLVTEKYFPTWVLPEEHPLVQAGARAAEGVLGRKANISKWTFSTNGVSSMGQLGIPSIGFGPAREEDTHSIQDNVRIDDLVTSVAFYAALPGAVLQTSGRKK